MKLSKKDDVKIIKRFSGHSGCVVELYQNDKEFFVRKSSASPEYNIRLKKQFAKQKKFVGSLFVKTPTILNYGMQNGLFYFDMQFVRAQTLAEYIHSIRITEIADFVRCLFKSLYLNNNLNNSNAKRVFSVKIESLENKLAPFLHLKEAFYKLKEYDWSRVYKSPCHGDLTLENIMITSDHRLYLIDFLDSFYNSWMIDLAKLFQDVVLKWSFRYQKLSPDTQLRLHLIQESLTEEILIVPAGREKLSTIYHILLLNVLRIYPYVKDEVTRDFLDATVDKMIYFLNSKQEVFPL